MLTMRLGPPRANWKPVAQVTDRAGRVLAFVKIGHDELTSTLVRHESDALHLLAERPLADVRVPEVRGTVQQDDLVALVLSPLEAPEPPAGDAATRRVLLDVVSAIAAPDRRARQPWGASAFAGGLARRLAAAGARALPAAQLLRRLMDERGGEELTFAPWHGDLNPGNVRLAARGPSVVWDWERYSEGVPLGLDLLHHDLTSAMDVQPPVAAAASLASRSRAGLESLGLTSSDVLLVTALHLLELVTRYLEDRQDQAGSPLGRIEEWALPALETTVREAVEEHR
ncbi:phosphotransferase [Pseudokineococcus marinus]|nr:phosphotransferase [Pseudokineococcus marinus]